MQSNRSSTTSCSSVNHQQIASTISLVVTGPTSLVRSSVSADPSSPLADKGEEHFPEHLVVPNFTLHRRYECDTEDCFSPALSDSEVGRKKMSKAATVGASTGKRLAIRLASTEHKCGSVESIDSQIQPGSATPTHKSLKIVTDKTSSLEKKRGGSKRPTRRISCKDLGNGQCQGWLMKKKEAKGLSGSKWSVRWCVLHNKSLYYYKNAEWDLAEGVIYLPGFQVSPASEVKNKKFAFKAHHPGMTYYFAAERQDDMAKWMNKLALASLGDLTLDRNIRSAAGLLKPELRQVKSASHLDIRRVAETEEQTTPYCSDSDHSRPASGTPSASNSSEDLTDLYRNIRRADLDLAGSNVKNRRSTVLMTEAQRSESLASKNEHDNLTRKLLSLKRTLKDKEQRLSTIEKFLEKCPTVTSEDLRAFVDQHPHIASLAELSAELVADSVNTCLRLSSSATDVSVNVEPES